MTLLFTAPHFTSLLDFYCSDQPCQQQQTQETAATYEQNKYTIVACSCNENRSKYPSFEQTQYSLKDLYTLAPGLPRRRFIQNFLLVRTHHHILYLFTQGCPYFHNRNDKATHIVFETFDDKGHPIGLQWVSDVGLQDGWKQQHIPHTHRGCVQ